MIINLKISSKIAAAQPALPRAVPQLPLIRNLRIQKIDNQFNRELVKICTIKIFRIKLTVMSIIITVQYVIMVVCNVAHYRKLAPYSIQ